ncbi:PduA family propanediol utilization polyhedral body protein [Proteus hauseri ATCC 700826]|uniref:PduA family propanediol utilization polyhedral body protein n=1 Tax=Proteus hauseri ATCC 700826 TaxID=1354271 RepID=A0AAJ3HPV9_PROHU|nr:BMC domain-containing protein [Proteus hauseri]OAT44988.1 PduA family propanediol utilization polyhedral body protein [Proteus hauseri ATCC 700826]
MKSLGVIETRGLTAAIQAADAACKAANVEIVGYRKVGSGLVSVCFQGEISAVKTAIDHGVEVVSQSELVIGSLVIARPEPSVITKLLTIKSKKKASSVEAVKSQTVVNNIVDTVAEKIAEKPIVSSSVKELADPLTYNVVSETKAVADKTESSKKENKPESRKGKK